MEEFMAYISRATLIVAGIGVAGVLIASDNALAATAEIAASCDGCLAVIADNGTIVRDYGLNTSTRLTTGEYRLDFSNRVANCAASATIEGTAGNPGEITVRTAAGAANVNRLFVETFNSAGTNEDRPFHVSINCPG
jgi:hypothetical protein